MEINDQRLEKKIEVLQKAGMLEPAVNQFLADNVGLPTLQQQLQQQEERQQAQVETGDLEEELEDAET